MGCRYGISAHVPVKELVGVDPGVEDEGEFDELRIEVVAQALEHCSLAGADLSGENDKPLAAVDAIDQVRQRLFVLGAAIEERWIRAEIEGAFPEAEEGIVHSADPAARGVKAAHPSRGGLTANAIIIARGSGQTASQIGPFSVSGYRTSGGTIARNPACPSRANTRVVHP